MPQMEFTLAISFADAPAQLEQAKVNVQSLIKAGNDADAQTAIDKIVETFSGNPELPVVTCRGRGS